MSGAHNVMSLREALIVLGVAPRDNLADLTAEEFVELDAKLKPPAALVGENAVERWFAAVTVVREALPPCTRGRYFLTDIGARTVVGLFGFSALAKYESMIERDAIEVLDQQVKDLGLDDLLTDEPPDLEPLGDWIERRVCKELGVDRADWELPMAELQMRAGATMREAAQNSEITWQRNKAFVLCAHIEARRRMKKGDIRTVITLGSLLADWRSRRYGLDRMAAGKKRSEAAQPVAAAARRQRAQDEQPAWWKKAKDMAAELRRAGSQRSAWGTAVKIAPVLQKSPRQVHQVIKSLWH